MTAPYFAEHDVTLWQGHVADVLPTLEPESVNCVVTSPPYYGLRDYGVEGQIGLEASPGEYVEALRAVFAEVRRVLRPDGVLWLNLGDSYNTAGTRQGHRDSGAVAEKQHAKWYGRNGSGLPDKNLLGVPWRVAFALQDDGWTLRNDVIWAKPNAMPESVTDRLSTRYEHVFLFSRSRRYWFDLDPIREPLAYPELADGSRVFGGKNKTIGGGVDSTSRTRGHNVWTPVQVGPTRETESGTRTIAAADPSATAAGTSEPTDSGIPDLHLQGSIGEHEAAVELRGRNPGDVWTIATQPYGAAHFATMPPELARRCITAGCPPHGTVLDPFAGSGTTLMVARRLLRNSVGIELNPAYCELIVDRIGQPIFDFGEASA
jgi:DNA modification methylase